MRTLLVPITAGVIRWCGGYNYKMLVPISRFMDIVAAFGQQREGMQCRFLLYLLVDLRVVQVRDNYMLHTAYLIAFLLLLSQIEDIMPNLNQGGGNRVRMSQSVVFHSK